ncbi:MAG: transferase [Armatimonadota bacterium]|nr:MAG: transferase [Armatimonadota bacterium]
MENLAIIPARGGSKSVPRKNLLPLAGKPLIASTIEAALQAETVSRVVVSTDDAEIAIVSEKHGAEVVWRPEEISGDRASSESALLHVLEHLDRHESYRPDLLVFLQCTSPLTTSDDIDGCVRKLLEENADSCLSVAAFHSFLWRNMPDNSAEGINHDKSFRPRRQEMEPQYRETGAVYVMRTEGFLAARHRFFGKTVLYVVDGERCLEIDEPVDVEIAEVLMRQRGQLRKMQALPDPVRALVMDFDGVLTDNRVYVMEDGREAVACSRGDGMGIVALRRQGLDILVLSSEENPVVAARCRKLKVECLQGVERKLAALEKWLEERGIPPESTVYVGNDVNDLECLRFVGCPVVVADAHPDVKPSARFVLSKRGGQGAIRELCDLILQQRERQLGSLC